jgi:hypothetical protein
MDIPQAINGISRGLDIANKIKRLATQANNLELVEFATDLRVELSKSKNALADATEEIASLKKKNLEMQSENDRLIDAQKTKETLILKDGVYYGPNETGPYCPGCQAKNGTLTPLVPGTLRHIKYKCPNCHATIGR